MNILIVAATEGELSPLQNWLASHNLPAGFHIDVLITGVGMLETTWTLTHRLTQHKYDLAIQAGVGGSFNDQLEPGELVHIASETYGDLGAEDHDAYIDIFEMGLIDGGRHPYQNGSLPAPELTWFADLKKGRGLTVNMVSGNERTIAHRKQRYQCDVESMEGAAFHYVCLQAGIPFGQVRAISNAVIPRDKSLWKMKEAIIALNNWLIEFIRQLQ